MANLFGRFVPVIVFLIVPSIYGIFIIWDLYHQRIANDFSISISPWGVGLEVLLLGYGVIPLRFITEEDFRKRGYENISTEFETTKEIFVTIIYIIVIFFIIGFLYGLGLFNWFFPTIIASAADGWYGAFIVAAIGAGLRILTQIAKKDFRINLARGYYIIATRKEDEFEKTRYLSLALDSYNKYLRQRSEVEIKDIKKIYSRFLYADGEVKSQILKSIYESLEGDKLKLARYLSSIYKVPETEFFVGESIVQKLKIVGTFLVAAIPIVISIIQLTMKD